jgi:uncharacterized protein involved in exopolysaccharide biosynthesis
MPSSPPALADIARLFVRYPMRWLVPAAAVAIGIGGYAFLKPATWQATQTLVVRGEATGNVDGPGRFRHLTEMKTLEETLVEVAKSRAALTAVLEKVGPPPGKPVVGNWPTPRDVDDLSADVELVPPKGAEFGATEMFYLRAKAVTPEQACALADAVADELLERFRKLRDDRAGSVVAELEQAAELARHQRAESVAALGKFEAGVGGDLAELRNLDQLGSGDGDVRKVSVELENEMRQAEQAVRNLRELKALLEPASLDPTKLLATPNRLLDSQPALRRLKDGLVDAQLRTSQLLGSMSREHPLVRAALDSEAEVRARMHAELSAALTSVETELAPAEALVRDRQERLAASRARLDRLASSRAEYSALNAEYQHRTRQLEQAEKQLLDARAAQAGATVTSLVARVGVPDAGSKPVGPGKTMLLLMGVVGGLVVGVGCLLLTIPQPVAKAETGQMPPNFWAHGEVISPPQATPSAVCEPVGSSTH